MYLTKPSQGTHTTQTEIQVNGLSVREHLARKIEQTVIPKNSPDIVFMKINSADYLMVVYMPMSVDDEVADSFIRGIDTALRLMPRNRDLNTERSLYHIYFFPDEINLGKLVKDVNTIMNWKALYSNLNFKPLNLVVTKDEGSHMESVIKNFTSTISRNTFQFKKYENGLLRQIAESIRIGDLSSIFDA